MSIGESIHIPDRLCWSCELIRRGMGAGGVGGGVAAGRLGMGAGGAGVPALPRPVVGVSLAAGDKPQPYIRSAALPPDGWG